MGDARIRTDENEDVALLQVLLDAGAGQVIVPSARFTYMKTLWSPFTRTATMMPVPNVPVPSVFEIST